MPSNLTKQFYRFIQLRRLLPLITIMAVIFSLFHVVQPAKADADLSISPITWDVMGLDSNNVSVGPNNFPVGIRVCNAGGADPATNVNATFAWTSSTNSTNIYSRPGSYTTIPGPMEAAISINPGACHDFYFEVEVARDPASRGKTRPYQITVTADGGVSLTYPQAPQTRQVFVEWLVSQSRNSTTNVTLDGVDVGPGGTMTLMVGSSYTITLYGSTATNGYEQIETFINFPNTIFQVNSVTTTYSAEDTTSPDPWAGSKLYADGCNWENDPASLNYRSCLGVGKYGGTISVAYNVTIIGGSGTTDTLNTLIYDFSGSSYHYNADFSTNGRIIRIVNAGIEKAFEPKTVLPGGTSNLTFTLTNPGTSTISDLNFSDPLPLGLTVAAGILANVCNGTGTVTLTHNTSPTPDTIALSDASLGPGVSCSFPVTVTASSTASGLYTNMTNNLFIGSNDTEDDATDYVQVTTLPAPPDTCGTPTVLATWTIPDGSGPPPNELINPLALVDFAEATAAVTGVPESGQSTSVSGVTTNAWQVTDAWTNDASGVPGVSAAPYIQFEIDTSDYGQAQISFQYALETNQQWGANNNNWVYVYSSTDGTNFTLAGSIDATKGSWQPLQTVTAAATGVNHTYFRITAKTRGNQPVASILLDNITIDGCGRSTAPTLDKAFQDNPITVGDSSVLRFTLQNPNASSLTGVAFTDILPTGLVISSPNGLSTTCSFGTSPITAAAGTRTVSLSGATLAANETCTIDIDVTGQAAGFYNNLTSNITSTATGPNTTADGYGEDDLTVIAPPIIDKSFGANAILTGSTTTLTFSIINPNSATSLTGVSFIDTLAAGLDVEDATFPNVCAGSGTLATNDNAPLQDTVVLSGTSLAPLNSCTFSVNVNGTTAGLKHNTVQIYSTNGGPGNNAEADLLVRDPIYDLSFLKQVGLASAGPWSSHLELNAGSDVYYRFVVENTGDQPLTDVSVSDDDVPASLNPSTCTWYHLEGSPESPVYFVDADGNPGNGFQLTIPTASADNNMHVAYCVLGPVTALPDLHTNHASADSNETAPDPDEASYFGNVPAIQVVKDVSVDGGITWVPADTAPGPYLLSGTNPLFRFAVANTGNATLTSIQLIDTDMSTFYADVGLTTACMIPLTLAPSESFTCYGGLAWAAGQHQDTAIASGTFNTMTVEDTNDGYYMGATTSVDIQKTVYLGHNDGNTCPGSESVSGVSGTNVTYCFVVDNPGNLPLVVSALNDPALGQTLPGLTYHSGDGNGNGRIDSDEIWTYYYDSTITADLTNTATVTASPVDGTGADIPTLPDVSDNDTASVNAPPTITVDKTANPTSLPEPGGGVDFTVVVTNDSSETVTLNSLTDDVYGELNGRGTCVTGGTINAGGSYTCTFTGMVSGEPGSHVDIVTIEVTDDDGMTGTDDDDATVTLTDVLPTVELTKTADPLTLPEPGGDFVFTLAIHNTSPEAVTITDLSDDNALSAECLALVGTSIPAGETVSCTYTVSHSEPGSYGNNASVDVQDNEGSTASDSDNETVTVSDVLPTVELTKTADPLTLPEPGGDFVFTLAIHNNSPEAVTITALSDDYPLSAECLALVGTSLAAGETGTCTYTVTHTEAGSYDNTASVTVEDNESNTASDSDNETVTVSDELPAVELTKTADPQTLPEPGGVFTFTLAIHNNSPEAVTITALSDDYPLSAECTALVGTSLAPGETATCTYTVTHTGAGSYDNTASVTVEDNESNTASDSDDETVTVSDELPTVELTKTADPQTLPEPGGVVTFTVTILNSSSADDPVTIISIVDNVHGDLNGQGTCSVLQTIQPGDSYTCQFSAMVEGSAGYTEIDVVTAVGHDDEDNQVEDSDDAEVRIVEGDGIPGIEVTKTADPIQVFEPGGVVAFTVVIENLSGQSDPVTITSLVDDVHGDLDGQGTCSVPQTIQPGESYTCIFAAMVSGNAGYSETDIVTASGTDDEGTPVSDDDDATVTVVEAPPVIAVAKTADPTHVVEPGGLVTFTVVISNLSSPTDPVTITSLVDDIHGNLNGQGTCSMPQPIQPGDSYTCSFTVMVSGNAGYSETDTVTALGTDDEGTPVRDTDDATVTVTAPFRYFMPLLLSGFEATCSSLTSFGVTVGYEDLPISSPNDYDYNDWITDITGTLDFNSRSSCGLERIDLSFTPQARGAVYDHTFHMLFPAHTFASDGTATLTIYDQDGAVLSTSVTAFDASVDHDFTIFSKTSDVLPVMANTREGITLRPPGRTAHLTIEFDTLAPFVVPPGSLDMPHGQLLFFDPYLFVINTADSVHRGDFRLLTVPEATYQWPEEERRIDTVYAGVEYSPGPPPMLNFESHWWELPHNNCVFGDGVVCPLLFLPEVK